MINLKKPFLIAEIGINHNGNIKKTYELIQLAHKYGFDAVKFQKREPEISTPDFQKNLMRQTPWGYISYIDYKKKIEFGNKEYKLIDNYCKKLGIQWFASAWDIESQKFLKKFKCKYNKIASAMLTNYQLCEIVAKEKKHTFISTGMSNLNEIERTIKIFKKNRCKFTLLHCVSSYPCPDEKLNLNTISTLKKKFKCPVGYSGHETSTSPSLLAYILGAEVIERHITLDRSNWGTDQAASLEEQGIRNLTSLIKKSVSILGNGVKKKTLEDKKLLKKFKYW
jgi:N-acetylneuraminate synthase|tara:strand:- start:34425 stop:35267 length:843 start_codon:yes stop_codon:yes gene_type:complete